MCLCDFVQFEFVYAEQYHHSRVLDFLDGGIASSSRVDGLGKGIAEYLRSKYVDIPVKSLSQG